MARNDPRYHRERERQCRELAERASDPDVRRRHVELAELHASLVPQLQDAPELGA